METDAGSSQHDDDVQRPSPSTTPNYAAQMGRVLGDDDEDEEADEFDSFVYSGADADEAAQQALYQQQLADVLDSPTEANSQPPPAAQPSIPQTNGVLHHVPPVPVRKTEHVHLHELMPLCCAKGIPGCDATVLSVQRYVPRLRHAIELSQQCQERRHLAATTLDAPADLSAQVNDAAAAVPVQLVVLYSSRTSRRFTWNVTV